jgi:hypothetical protein
MDFKRVKLISLLTILLFLTGLAASSNYATNSMDWTDVHAGMQYAFSQGAEEAYFARSSDASGLTTIMPKGDSVTLLESTDRPYTENLDSILESRGYNVNGTTQFEDASTELAEGENFIVVSESYPSAAVAVMPLAEQLDAWVIVVNNENLEATEQILQGAEGEVILAGVFRRDLMSTLGDYSTEQIIEPNKFELSVKLTERYLEEKPETERVLVTDGSKLESDLVKGDNPILISGTNLIPEPVDRFLFQNPEHNLESTVMVGNEMTSVGQSISDQNITRNGETTNEQMDVFIKYGQARGDSSQIYALSMFPLPTEDIDLRIGEVRYEPEENRLIVNYRNMGQSKMYALTTMRITNNEQEVGSAGDDNPIFISGNSTRTVEYQTNLTPEEYENARVEFSTSYGETPDNLDTYLTEEGRFSPPVEKQIQVEKVEDNSSLEIVDAVYMTDIQRIRIDVENTGNVTTHFSAVVEGLTVRGIEEDFSTGTESVEPGETTSEYIPVELDSVDQEENDQLRTSLRYGEDSNLKVNSKEETFEFRTSSRGLTSQFTGSTTAGASVILLIVIAGLFYKREIVMEKINGLK